MEQRWTKFKNEILRKIYGVIFDIEQTIKYKKKLREETGVVSAVDYKRRIKSKDKMAVIQCGEKDCMKYINLNLN